MMYFSDASFISLLCVTIVFVVCRPLSVHFTVVCFFSSSSLLHLCSFFFFSLCRWVERWMWLCVFFLGEVSSDLVSPQVKEKEKVRRKEKYHSHVSTKAHTHTHSLSSPCLHTFTSIYALSALYVLSCLSPHLFTGICPFPSLASCLCLYDDTPPNLYFCLCYMENIQRFPSSYAII